MLRLTSPHAHADKLPTTAVVMQLVILATIPGTVALTLFFGWGVFINLAITSLVAVICEAAVMVLRKRPVMLYLKDYSALVTAILLGLSLPPLAPWWIAVIGTGFAIVIAKQLYGGLGYNPFNPAMIGYVVLLISFPIQMSSWPAPASLYPVNVDMPSLWQSLQIVFPFLQPAATNTVDAFTAATPLDIVKHNSGLLLQQLYQQEPLFQQGHVAGVGWEWVNAGFLAGGCFLLYRKVFTWHAPIAMLVTLTLCATLFYDGGSSTSKGSPLLHLLSGATMLGAFFIITDPVSTATSNLGRLVSGGLAGLLIFIIRSWGNYPDAVAFAVLLMNFSAPLIDNYTLPRTYGHKKSRKATEKLPEKRN